MADDLRHAGWPAREDIIAILAEVGQRPPELVSERIDSLELARLVYEMEYRYDVHLDLTDERLVQMSTVGGAADVVRAARAAADG
ncbi:hypothetical protein [Phytohabitans rumicis]|nr:hypothetical protein [Phytohabitans rumicis]